MLGEQVVLSLAPFGYLLPSEPVANVGAIQDDAAEKAARIARNQAKEAADQHREDTAKRAMPRVFCAPTMRRARRPRPSVSAPRT
jgi:hypothetical protein